MTRYSKQVQMTNQSGSWVSFSSKVKLQQLIQSWCWAKFIAAAIAHLAPTASVSCPHCTNGPRRAEMLLNHVRMAGNSVKSVELKNYTESRNVKNIAMEFQEPARLLTSQYFRAFTAHLTPTPSKPKLSRKLTQINTLGPSETVYRTSKMQTIMVDSIAVFASYVGWSSDPLWHWFVDWLLQARGTA